MKGVECFESLDKSNSYRYITRFYSMRDHDLKVIKRANDTEYGLAAGIHTSNITTAITVANSLRAGTIWLNQYNLTAPQTPFGGFKQSGMGRELGSYAIDAYTEVKCVKINLTAKI